MKIHRGLAALVLAVAMVGVAPSPASAATAITGLAQFNDGVPVPGFAANGHGLVQIDIADGAGTFVVRHNWLSGFDNQVIVGTADSVTIDENTAVVEGTCTAIRSAGNPLSAGPCTLELFDGQAAPAAWTVNQASLDSVGFAMPDLAIGTLASADTPSKGQVEHGGVSVTSA